MHDQQDRRDMHNTLFMKQPANSEGRMWMTALPVGDGITGGLVYGAVGEETVIVTRHDMWQNVQGYRDLPDISDSLQATRQYIDEGRFKEANTVMQDRLAQEGYTPSIPAPIPVGMLSLRASFNAGDFRKYRRGIDMAQGTAFVEWEKKGTAYSRHTFVSRDDGYLYTRVRSGDECTYLLSFGVCNHFNPATYYEVERVKPTEAVDITDKRLVYEATYDGTRYGAVIDIQLNGGGQVGIEGNTYRITSPDFTVRLLTYVRDVPADTVPCDFDTALAKHTAHYARLYAGTDIRLSYDGDPDYGKSNEELLADAYETCVSPVMCEKLWRFGRYLFISGTSPHANPFSLVGLWAGDYNVTWPQNVCNENVEMIYWHTQAGGLSDAMEGLIRYYVNKLPAFRDNAEKLFGCRGIYVPAYTFPRTLNGQDIAPPVPCASVVLNWISGAGWLSCQFMDYYRYTENRDLFREKILPFMIETARFYADYVVFDQNGKCRIYPSVSPENTPGNYLDGDCRGMGYLPYPVTENAVMDHAILKAFLTDILSVDESELPGVTPDETDRWRAMLRAIPDYEINGDGALKEWISPTLKDNYAHRHFSHIFPLFPGHEIDADTPSPLLSSAERAVDLRLSDARSGWAFAHSACIYARLRRGEAVMENIDMMARSCILNNFLTMHNDWRHMGVSMYIEHMPAPVQLDALMGIVNAVQEMLFTYRDGRITLLPALSERFTHIEADNLHFPGGTVSFRYDNGRLDYTVRSEEQVTVTSPCGTGCPPER